MAKKTKPKAPKAAPATAGKGDATKLMAQARAAAGPFEPSGQREGRPLFEDGQYTICPQCNALKLVVDCLWSDTWASKRITGVVGMRFDQDGALTLGKPGICKACVGLAPVGPPEPASAPRFDGWKLAEDVEEDTFGPGWRLYRCEVCGSGMREADLSAMVLPRDCPRCVRVEAERVLRRPRMTFNGGRRNPLIDGAWASAPWASVLRPPTIEPEPEPEPIPPSLRTRKRLITLPDD